MLSAGIMNGGNFSSGDTTMKIHAGLCFQKFAGFYWVNGISAEYSSQKILQRKLEFGFNFLSSRMGTALKSNAIPYWQTELVFIKRFRKEKMLKPQANISLGYAWANYGSDKFRNITDKSALLALQGGATMDFKFPLRLELLGAYNIIYGNGIKGLGLIYPFYAQMKILYKI